MAAYPELATSLEVDPDDGRLLQAEAAVRGYCRWHISPSRAETLTVDGSGSELLLLPTLYLTAVTSVTDSENTTLELADVEWSQMGALRMPYGSVWSSKFRGVTVDIVHGHEEVPPDITGVVQALALRASSQPGGLLSKTTGPFSETYAQTFLETERMVLDRYRIPL